MISKKNLITLGYATAAALLGVFVISVLYQSYNATNQARSSTGSSSTASDDTDGSSQIKALTYTKRCSDINHITIAEETYKLVHHGTYFGNYGAKITAPADYVDFHDISRNTVVGIRTEAKSTKNKSHIITHNTISDKFEYFSEYTSVEHFAKMTLTQLGITDLDGSHETVNGHEWVCVTGYSDRSFYERPKQCLYLAFTRTTDGNYHSIIVEAPQDKASVQQTLVLGNAAINSFQEK